MADQPYGPQTFVPTVPSVFKVLALTTTLTQFDVAGTRCVGVLIQVPTFDDTPAAVDAYVYVSIKGVIGAELAPGESRFFAVSNSNQIKAKIVTGAGGTNGFIRCEIVRSAWRA